jgi:hypothetical protein
LINAAGMVGFLLQQSASLDGRLCTSSAFSCSLFFTGSNGTYAEGFGTITKQNQRPAADVRQLIIFLRRKKNDFIFLDDPFLSLNAFNRALTVDDQKSLWGLVKVHGSAVTGFEVKHPRAKIVSFEKMSISCFFPSGLIDLSIQTNEIHLFLLAETRLPRNYRRLGSLVNRVHKLRIEGRGELDSFFADWFSRMRGTGYRLSIREDRANESEGWF